MANTVFQLRRNAVSSTRPTTLSLSPGELAINTTDGILFSANATSIFEIGGNLTSIAVGNTTTRQTANSTGLYVNGTITTSNASVTGNLVIGASGDLLFTNGAGVQANGSFGTAGQALSSNGTGVYWATVSGTVTSVATGSGLTGGTITTTGTLSVLANTGIVANATGLYVNAAYINTISSNSASYANASVSNTFTVGTAAYFVSNGNVGIGTSSPDAALTVNTVASFGAGAAALPSIAAKGDLNTGMWFPAADTIAASTAGAERLRIDSSGNVGIGNTAPTQKLHVQGTAFATSDFRAPIFYDSANTAFYADPAGQSQLYRAVMGPFAGSATSAGVVTLEIKNNGGTGDSNVAAIAFHCSGTYAMHQHLRADGIFGIGGWSASSYRWYVNMTNGDMTAAGNVTAYSDPRLKEEIQKIESPVEKLKKLNGVRFRWKNNTIVGHPGEYDYGVLANEVQEVFPEIVSDTAHESPDGDKYKAVAYDKLVPVLIEAFKTQQNEIDELKSLVKTLMENRK